MTRIILQLVSIPNVCLAARLVYIRQKCYLCWWVFSLAINHWALFYFLPPSCIWCPRDSIFYYEYRRGVLIHIAVGKILPSTKELSIDRRNEWISMTYGRDTKEDRQPSFSHWSSGYCCGKAYNTIKLMGLDLG